MVKLNIFLFVLLIISGLAIVTARYEARKLFMEQEKEQKLTEQLETEWNQLRLEQTTLAMPARVENIARKELGMTMPLPPAAGNILVIRPDYATGAAE
ncbi:MAG: cell division protein FtsL [Nitrosomonas sp.]|uniref:cell division protein FtsL n=1 Tax=Nitrosomonas sp. TaxID=42353 RepID=UPI002561F5C8|nr:cell division protein FtsL [Nitrosomonas sp.]MBE7527887.1 cell division protein FtsL [Burkholderiales bacterium]MCC6160936.1 cell division protein FtsL [Nitrosomonas sp.]MDL1865669.1 cell division protein FtsL [Betaproteobacteria bacterium PRO4]